MHFGEIELPDCLGEKVDLPIKTQKNLFVHIYDLTLLMPCPLRGVGESSEKGHLFQDNGEKGNIGEKGI